VREFEAFESFVQQRVDKNLIGQDSLGNFVEQSDLDYTGRISSADLLSTDADDAGFEHRAWARFVADYMPSKETLELVYGDETALVRASVILWHSFELTRELADAWREVEAADDSGARAAISDFVAELGTYILDDCNDE